MPRGVSGDTDGMVRVERCSMCGGALPAQAQAAFFPFCSQRCRDRDLGAWLSGGYTIAQELESPALEDTDRP